jgi:hypothetical protein
MEFSIAEGAAPRAFGRSGQRRVQAVHVIATVTVVAEQQLVLEFEIAIRIHFVTEKQKITSLSEVPHTEQHLHSMHCHLYLRTEIIILAVNCRQEG